MNKTYYFIEFEHLEFPQGGFYTGQQLTWIDTKKDPDPVSILRIDSTDFYRGWMRLNALHESVDKTPRRMAGDPEYLHQSIIGGDRYFNCYYNHFDKTMIMNTSKTNMLGLQRRLIQTFPDKYKPYNKELDFTVLLSKLKSNKIVSSWFNNIQGRVNAVGLYGQRVNLDDIFSYYKEIGSLSAITVEWIFEDEELPINVMFTKNFGVVLYSNWDINRELDFLFELRDLLFNVNGVMNK